MKISSPVQRTASPGGTPPPGILSAFGPNSPFSFRNGAFQAQRRGPYFSHTNDIAPSSASFGPVLDLSLLPPQKTEKINYFLFDASLGDESCLPRPPTLLEAQP